MRRPALAAIASVTGALLVACGGETPSGEAAPVADGARRVEVGAASLAFVPVQIEMVAGTDVAIALRSTDVEHTLVIDEARFSMSASGGKRQIGGLRIDAPGRYDAYCSVPGHRAARHGDDRDRDRLMGAAL